jgi:hypothetical protein
MSKDLNDDSVSLVRQRVGEPLLASQDETINSVVTLAAIEVKLQLYYFRNEQLIVLTPNVLVWQRQYRYWREAHRRCKDVGSDERRYTPPEVHQPSHSTHGLLVATLFFDNQLVLY